MKTVKESHVSGTRFKRIREYHKRVMERNREVYEKTIENKEDRPFAYGLCFSKLFWLFFIGSLFGTILETFYALIFDGHFEIRTGMVIGPFIPVYGGGAVLNWSFIQKGYCDEVSLVVAPAADGSVKTQTLFMAKDGFSDDTPVSFSLLDVQKEEGGAVWLRYRVQRCS